MTPARPLATQRTDEPPGSQPDHVHRGGLLVVSPADMPKTAHSMVWLPDRLYLLTFSPTRQTWLLLVEDDLQWAATAQALAAPAAEPDTDLAAAPDSAPLLHRDHTYVVRHENPGQAPNTCRMTIAARGKP